MGAVPPLFPQGSADCAQGPLGPGCRSHCPGPLGLTAWERGHILVLSDTDYQTHVRITGVPSSTEFDAP